MSNIYQSAEQLIGGTPLVEISRFSEKLNLKARLLAKVESRNPGGSAKDRVAMAMLLDAEEKGLLQPGATIIEPTSGNTGIGLALMATLRGYKSIIVMPDSMSVERQKLMAAYGAEVVLTPGAEGMTGAIAKAKEIAQATPGSFIPGQLRIPPTPWPITAPPARKSGRIPTEMWIFSWRAWAPAAPSPAWAGI